MRAGSPSERSTTIPACVRARTSSPPRSRPGTRSPTISTPSQSMRPRTRATPKGLLPLLLLTHLDVDRDRDLVADQHAAPIERLVEDDPEVLTVDLGGRLRSDPSVPPRVCGGRGDVRDVERHGLRDPVQGEIPGELPAV